MGGSRGRSRVWLVSAGVSVFLNWEGKEERKKEEVLCRSWAEEKGRKKEKEEVGWA